MGFRVEKGGTSFLPKLKNHWKNLAAQQYLERKEEARKRTLEQAAKRDRRATSRILLTLTSSSKIPIDHNLMNDLDGEEISRQNSPKSISLTTSSQASRKNLLSLIKFKKVSTQSQSVSGNRSVQLPSNSGSRETGLEVSNTQNSRDLGSLIQKDNSPQNSSNAQIAPRSNPAPSSLAPTATLVFHPDSGLSPIGNQPTNSATSTAPGIAPVISFPVGSAPTIPSVTMPASNPSAVASSSISLTHPVAILSKKDKKAAKKAA
ncbi:uncharacterized protein MELLADRAFT_60352 [Melampsora larici-populina 98AG31]|uniref:Uncharacterized protein n=1 Tax=Melampsora larici-populina (strain 98AG31 / pathotype 3-4-7) TaxID=747676 RepID=F4RB12_MELLP|nr:uncharacterized protein MELLADRAFT_60352 [Melampsora larici-populina 98AG31]EGG10568.1 hypothetical protein MELLADRAFT_60352 [Melampsora larici-populina 98AG31]